MCKKEQNPNETASLQKTVDGLKKELEKVKNVVYAAKEVLNLEERLCSSVFPKVHSIK